MSDPNQAPGDNDIHGAPDATLGGYFRVHDRPPGYDGSDGHPYTVSIEVEKTPDLRAPWVGYLVFPKWGKTGLGVVGHVETPTLWQGRSEDEVRKAAGESSLERVQELLETAIAARDVAGPDEAGLDEAGLDEAGPNREVD